MQDSQKRGQLPQLDVIMKIFNCVFLELNNYIFVPREVWIAPWDEVAMDLIGPWK
jgi:hypothetical protein